MTKKILIALFIGLLFSIPFLGVSGQQIAIEGSLVGGDEPATQAITGALIGSFQLKNEFGLTFSSVALILPDWTISATGLGGGRWIDGFFVGGGILFGEPEIKINGGFATIQVWNDDFYLSSATFLQDPFGEWKFYSRLFVQGPEPLVLQGRIEAMGVDGSTVLSFDGGFRVFPFFFPCTWVSLGGEVAARICNDALGHVEGGVRIGLQAELWGAKVEGRFFYVFSNDGSEAWGLELATWFYPRHTVQEEACCKPASKKHLSGA